VAELAPPGIGAAVDTVGKGSVPELIAIVGDPSRVVTIADRRALELGAKLSSGMGSEPRATYALALAAQLYEDGRLPEGMCKVVAWATNLHIPWPSNATPPPAEPPSPAAT
jgi:hypothetical protein